MTLEDLKAKLNNLNGWQRAWLFICGILLVPHLLALHIFFPFNYVAYAPADNNRVIIQEEKWVDNHKESCEKAAAEVGKKSGFISDDAVAENFECYRHQTALSDARLKLKVEEDTKAEYRGEVFDLIFYTFLVYILMVGSIYLIGFGLAWVKNGFKK